MSVGGGREEGGGGEQERMPERSLGKMMKSSVLDFLRLQPA